MALQMLNLRAEAIDEAERLAAARVYALSGSERVPPHDPPGVLVTRARHRETRRRLAGRALLIFRVSCADATGRLVANHVVAVLCDLDMSATGRPSRRQVRPLIGAAAGPAASQVQRVYTEWIENATRVAGAFGEARLRREHEIAARTRCTPARPFQAGLFDRRAERARLAETAHVADREDDERSRLQMLEQSTAVAWTIDLMLALTP